jgi:hypothetical protein
MPTFIRLTDYKSSDAKEQGFFDSKNKYEAKQDDFEKIPGSPIAYWASDDVKKIYKKSNKLESFYTVKSGIMTGNDDYFLKKWYEVPFSTIGFNLFNADDIKISKKTWFPMNKEKEYRKWSGQYTFVLNLEKEGVAFSEYQGSLNYRLRDRKYYFLKGISWGDVGSDYPSFRFDNGSLLFASRGPMIFEDNKYLLGLLNSIVCRSILKMTNPTLTFNLNEINNIPLLPENMNKDIIIKIVQQNINISKEEWDSRETSWDFANNTLLKHKQDGQLENALNTYTSYWTDQFNTLHSNEEELNRLFIDIYDLQDELTPDVALEDITILKNEAKITNDKLVFDNKEIIKQFISYCVGCMFGRYTLDSDGLVVANQNQAIPTDSTFEIDDDNIIPIVDESDYFSDDMADRFTEFLRATFGSEKLQQNIAFIEASLGKKIRAYFMKDFYVDHTKRYKKRPIYWLFSSPNATFQVLIYMHRYTPDTLNHILNDYLRPFRIRLDTMRSESMRITESEEVSARDKTEADKKIDKIDKTLDDIIEYEKVLDHYAKQRIEIDLDDGVKVNYCKFKDLLFEFDKKLCK